jgi:putative membrane protein
MCRENIALIESSWSASKDPAAGMAGALPSAEAIAMYYYPYWGMSVVWWAFWIVALIALFAFAVPVPRSTWREYRASNPLATLQRRYAAGEISTAEYEERKTILERDSRLVTPAADMPPSKAPPGDPHEV